MKYAIVYDVNRIIFTVEVIYDFMISKSISGRAYEISASVGPLEKNEFRISRISDRDEDSPGHIYGFTYDHIISCIILYNTLRTKNPSKYKTRIKRAFLLSSDILWCQPGVPNHVKILGSGTATQI